MTDRTEQPDRFQVRVPNVPTLTPQFRGVSVENANKAEAPEGLSATNAITEWDADSLDKAIDWLEGQSQYLEKLYYRMAEIEQIMVSDNGKSPLGSFDMANELAAKHSTLYATTRTNLKIQSDNLDQAAKALRQVKDNYQTAEAANEMSAAQMRQIFGAAAGDA
ncbi:hypothetical protein [Melissospora conviva]|uniref:hypothetical protein n=1 Tax=Melissospora conviva TaxID=3388432 RepID=UPI003C1AD1BE